MQKQKVWTAERTKELLGKQSAELVSIVGVPAEGVGQFKGYFLDTFIQRAFRELDAPLGDLPDGLPPAS